MLNFSCEEKSRNFNQDINMDCLAEIAAKYNKLEIFRYLLQNGANPKYIHTRHNIDPDILKEYHIFRTRIVKIKRANKDAQSENPY